MRAYSMDLRRRVLLDVDGGVGTETIAAKYRVSTRWVQLLKRRHAETGQIAPREGKPGPKPRLAEHAEKLTQLARDNPDATLEELKQKLGGAASVTSLWRMLKKLGITLKKSPARG